MSGEQGATVDAAARRASIERRRRRRHLQDRVVLTVLALLAAIIAIYPVIGTYWNNYHLWQDSQHYKAQTTALGPVVQEAELRSARAYNAHLGPTSLADPVGGTVFNDPRYADYTRQLSATAAMAQIRIPSIKVDLPVFHGTSDEVLAKGAGHVYGTSLPVGGASTRAGISAHSGLPQITAFDRLEQVRSGDVFYIDVAGETLAYQVEGREVVLPTQMDRLKVVKGRDLVTLITCTPYAVNTHRLLVTGHRIPYNPKVDPGSSAKNGFDWTIQGWMWPHVIAFAISLLILLVAWVRWLYQDHQRRRELKKAKKAIEAV